MTNDAANDDHVADQRLDQFRADELGEADQQQVEAHLAGCDACSARLAEIEAFASMVERGYAVRRAAKPEPDWASQRAAVVARTSGRERSSRRAWLRYAPQAAAAMVALIAVTVVVRQGIRQPIDAEKLSQPEASIVVGDEVAPAAEHARNAESSIEGQSEVKQTETELDVAEAPAGERDFFKEEVAPEDQPAPVAEPAQRRNEAMDLDAAIADNRVDAEEAREVGALAEGEPEPLARDIVGGDEDRNRVAAKAAAPAVAPPDGPDEEALDDQQQYRAAQAVREDAAVANYAAPSLLDRYENDARAALAKRDSLDAKRALSMWRDSLRSGEDLEPERQVAAEALADSLMALLASLP